MSPIYGGTGWNKRGVSDLRATLLLFFCFFSPGSCITSSPQSCSLSTFSESCPSSGPVCVCLSGHSNITGTCQGEISCFMFLFVCLFVFIVVVVVIQI